MNLSEDYSDIIHLEHVTVPGHSRMPLMQRAAQFAPFAAIPMASSSDAPN